MGLASSKMKLGLVPGGPNLVVEDRLLSMKPGDVILLEDALTLRPMIDEAFFAILGCPWCGMAGLITARQYSGTETVMCGSDFCSCRFRIEKESRFEFLPAS